MSIAKTFSASTKKLSTADRGRVLDFLTKFMDDPSSPGLNFETIQGAKDGNMKSARITQDLRTILHQSNGMLTLLYAGHHEDAYRWAERRRMENHPVTGTLQIVETAQAAQYEVTEADLTSNSTRIFAGYENGYLLSLGVPTDWLTIIRQIQNDDQLLAVCQKLPEEVAERLVTLSTGELVTPPPPVPASAPVEQSPDNLRRFWIVQDAADLASVLDRPIEDWVRFLHPSQRLLVIQEFNGPAKVSGAAGTGKTVVGMHRARRLASQGKRVLLTSFVTTLCRNIERNIHILCAGTQNAFDGSTESRVTVSTVHRQALALAKATHPKLRPLESDKIEALVNRHHSHGGYLFDSGFLVTEWNAVVEPQGITTWEEYRDAVRTGRGKPLTIKQRKECWKVFARIWEDLMAAYAYPWSAICRIAREAVESGNVESPFDAVIVDEVQDLQPQELRFLKALSAQNPGDFMLLGDSGQRIYPGGFSLKKLGIDVRGRSHILRINYRTTEQIRRFADGLLATTSNDFDDGAEDRRSQSLLNGPRPTIREFPNEAEQAKFVLDQVRLLLEQGISPREIAVFARSSNRLKSIRDILTDAKLEIAPLNDEEDLSEVRGINLGTMHRAKGLEFKVVFVIDCNQGVVPHAFTLSKMRDQGDYDAAYERERQLLYVAITRARDEVFVTSVGKPSEFLTSQPGNTRG
ncbi:3'-5' exonuclease [Planctopirus hydrillae]|uniref:3'-5' exonuclease n=1 Tax=Planctopirus hydrillae TaxID=1841610 RepID=UPI0013F4CBD9|nr:3'-5' exonuclease [Planctopirus hydrillae]